MKAPVRDPVIIESKTTCQNLARIVQKNKRQKRLLQCIELAKERIKTRMSIADLAKRHNLTEHKVRRDIETAIFVARSSMFERTLSTKSTSLKLLMTDWA